MNKVYMCVLSVTLLAAACKDNNRPAQKKPGTAVNAVAKKAATVPVQQPTSGPVRKPGEPISAANNNPCAISFSYTNGGKARGAAKIMQDNGIRFRPGTADRKGIRVMWFDSLEDGVKACRAMLNSRIYRNRNLQNTLKTWTASGEKEVKNYLGLAKQMTGFPPTGKPIRKMTPRQQDGLIYAMSKWEGGSKRLAEKVRVLLNLDKTPGTSGRKSPKARRR